MDKYSFLDEDPEEEDFLRSEMELKKEVNSLKRQIKKIIQEHDKEIQDLRDQKRELLAKNWELSETCNLFAKGLDHFRKELRVITETTTWDRKGARGIEQRIGDLIQDSDKRIVAIAPLLIDAHGQLLKALIVTEKYTKVQSAKSIGNKLFKNDE